jgi:hypothetical protein
MNTTPTPHNTPLTIKVHATYFPTQSDPNVLRASVDFPETAGDAAATFAATFPKSLRVSVNRVVNYPADMAAPVFRTWSVSVRCTFARTGVTGTKNETSIRRYRALAKWADAAGHTLSFEAEGCAPYYYTDRADFEGAL